MAKRQNDTGTTSHGLADHAMGADLSHSHDGAFDHDHDAFEGDMPLEQNPLWLQDHVTLTSVGIDIGSSGTQVIFSKIFLRRLGEDLTSRYYVAARETLFQSDVALTPYSDETRIDDAGLKRIIGDAYQAAGIGPKDIDTGAVILTGEALRRENAKAISTLIAEQGGDFVCATAGHRMESMLAAYGSGAARVSRETGRRILNIDIGGGTTKLAVLEAGRVVATSAVHIGGRLLALDESRRIARLDPMGREHARRAGFDWLLGEAIDDLHVRRVAGVMAETLIDALSPSPLPADISALYLTDPLAGLSNIGGIMCSGGVAEYIYGREARDFGDLGRHLGHAIRQRLDSGALPWPLLDAGECIRATALGASEYSVQLSGNTGAISNPGALLPRRNLQVLQPVFVFGDVVGIDALAQAIRAHRKAFEAESATADIALAFHWRGAPTYQRIHAFARGLADGLADMIASRHPLYILIDGDIAQTLGTILREDCKVTGDILCIDGIMLSDFDYIDLGRVRLPSYTVPVTVKSLVFDDDPRRARERIHHADVSGGYHSHNGHRHRHD